MKLFRITALTAFILSSVMPLAAEITKAKERILVNLDLSSAKEFFDSYYALLEDKRIPEETRLTLRAAFPTMLRHYGVTNENDYRYFELNERFLEVIEAKTIIELASIAEYCARMEAREGYKELGVKLEEIEPPTGYLSPKNQTKANPEVINRAEPR